MGYREPWNFNALIVRSGVDTSGARGERQAELAGGRPVPEFSRARSLTRANVLGENPERRSGHLRCLPQNAPETESMRRFRRGVKQPGAFGLVITESTVCEKAGQINLCLRHPKWSLDLTGDRQCLPKVINRRIELAQGGAEEP
jgi:hypothetical protein